MRDINKSEEIQITSNGVGGFVRRPRLPFDDLLGEGVPQEHIDLVLEMRRLERRGCGRMPRSESPAAKTRPAGGASTRCFQRGISCRS